MTFFGVHGPAAYLLLTGSLCGAFAGTLALLLSSWRFIRKMSRLLDRFLGEDGTGKGGVLARLDDQDKALAHLINEIPPNGVPFRSDVDGLKAGIAVLEVNVANLRRDVKGVLRRLDTLEAEK